MSLELNDSGRDKIQQLLFRKGLKLEGLLKKNSPVFTGQYKNLWETQKNDDGTVSVIHPQGEKARALEFGGGEGEWPKQSEMRKWVRRKLGAEDVSSATYLVSRKIFNEGIEPQPHIRKSLRQFKNKEL